MTHDPKLHKPSTAEYGDYTYLCSFYLGSMSEEFADYFSEVALSYDAMTWEQAKAQHPTYQGGNFAKKNTCDHCGAWFKWGCAYLHTPSGELVHVGHQCAGNSFDYPSRAAKLKADAQQKLAKLNKIKKEREKLFAANPGLEEAAQIDHYIVKDIMSRFDKWFSISKKQIDLVLKISDDVKAKAESKASEPEGEPCPKKAEREMVRGTVVSIKEKVNDYGVRVMMLVQDDRGFRVWGTLPSKLDTDEVGRGAVVEFCADIERSYKDEFFGFYKRPTKARLVQAAASKAA